MKPFLKWAGNKHRIFHKIKPYLLKSNRLIEPFLGSAAVFLNTSYQSYLLGDNNFDLIQLYKYLQKEGQFFIDYCRFFFKKKFNTTDEFYRLRRVFNNTKKCRQRAALLLYLNKHCFNGLARFNQKGEFNTPFSPYKNPYFPEKEMQYFYKHANKATFIHGDFLSTLASVKQGDIVYCDPPYVGLSNTANFTQYTSQGFSRSQQLSLAKTAKYLASKGIRVIISNHDTEFTRYIYREARLISFSVQRNISSKSVTRKKTKEILAIFS
ncbi:Dam family site-specific DNA-(adenine-N6)-methyltransferase [Rickettsiella grylli]|uniref:Site-specific DNA-methyltransferase (adenine-specific) n=1 Tax=Rickettsiella grylli TaxID=59196 RepID=A8PKK4_9COXI|nr:Dam family site-specific DNA-(adenine-N6)-methyltransferase [Rickettsiella grylli]EDP46884.1 DNA adenine methylase (Deoxyadenosyl-methyltransferase)(DNA adenine methyltransferase) (M.EcoDam) [Rickettsiella grylli]